MPRPAQTVVAPESFPLKRAACVELALPGVAGTKVLPAAGVMVEPAVSA
jgi:hypothetical protein